MEAANKLKSKYVVVILDCAAGMETGEHSKVPVLKAKVAQIWETEKRFSYPSVFMLNADASKVLYRSTGSWRESSKTVREIRKALEDVEVVPPQAPAAKKYEPKFEAWVNNDGKTIKAKLMSKNSTSVVFKMSTGKQVNYPWDNLSPESQNKATELLSQ